MKKRFLSILTALLLVLSLLPSSALAAGASAPPTASGTSFFANGTPIDITAERPAEGALEDFGTGFTATGADAYISWQEDGTTKYVGVRNDVTVWGGSDGSSSAVTVPSASITMTGGTVKKILGGNLGQAAKTAETCSTVTGNVDISIFGGTVTNLIYGGGENNTCVKGIVTITLDEVTLGSSCYVNGGVLGHGTEGTRNIEEGTMTTYAEVKQVVIKATNSTAYVLGGGGSGSTKVLDADVTLNGCTVDYLYVSGINGEMGTSSLKATGCTITGELAATNRGFVHTADVTLEDCTIKLLQTGATVGCFGSDSSGPDGSGITGFISWNIDAYTTAGKAVLTPLAIRDQNDAITATFDNITVEKAGDPLNISVETFEPDNNDSNDVSSFLVSETGTLTLKNVNATVTAGQTLTNLGTIDMDETSMLTVDTNATLQQMGDIDSSKVTNEGGTVNNNYVARIGTTGYGTLTDAITAANGNNGGTITLLTNITNDNVGTAADDSIGEKTTLNVLENITINGNGHSITLTVPNDDTTRNQVINIGQRNATDAVTLTLNDVVLTIKGRASEDGTSVGDAFNMWGGANLEINNSTVDLDDLSNAFVVQVVGANIKIDDTTMTANNIGGNFSQGGYWMVQNNSSITVDNCVSHGMSVSSLTVSDSTVTVSNAGKRGVSINDADGKLYIQSGSVNVISCVKEESYNSAAVVLGSQATGGLHVAEGATLSVTGTNDKIALNTEDGTTNTLAGKIIGTIQDSSDNPIVAVVEDGGSYTTLSNALAAIDSNGGTVNLVADATLSEAIDSDETIVVKSGATLTVDLTQATVRGSTGTISVEAGGKLIAKTGADSSINMIGDEAYNIQLTDGKIDVSMADLTSEKIDIDFVDAKASVPASGYWTLAMTSGGIEANMDVTLDDSSELTVNGELRIANGSTLTNNGTLVVNSGALLRVGSQGKIEGSGGITNSGTVTLHEKGTNQASVTPAITLASGGVVYSQFAVADDKIGPSGNVSHSTGSYTLDNVTSGDPPVEVVFTEQYTYYTPSSSSGSSGTTRYTVSVPSDVENGKVTVSPSRASRGSTVTVTVTPDEGYELDTLTVTDSDGNALTLTDKGDGKYTFTMPRGAVEIAASFKAVEEEPQPSGFPFTDVAEGAWYYDAVAYAWENDLMTGTSAATFAPGMTTDRAMLATLLWRLEGSPSVDYLMDFDDVAKGLWYSEAVRWAASEGVVAGVGDGSSFAPTGAITREQMAVMLYRYAQYKGYDVTGSADLSGYADADSVSSWAQYAVAWAVDAGLISGVGNNTLNPQGSATRAEIATILMRFVEAFVPAE